MNIEDLRITTCDDGDDYVFISYSSKDSDTVFNDYLLPLQEKYGLKLFCDIDFQNHAKENWTDQMGENIADAKLCILFVSKSYVCSYACFLEVYTAITNDIPILKIQIEKPEESSSNKVIDRMSSSTKECFQELSTILEDEEYQYYRTPMTKVNKYIKTGKLPVKRLSTHFVKVLKDKIPGTNINISNGLEAVKKSIDGACDYADIYEDISTKPEPADDEVTKVSEEILTESEKETDMTGVSSTPEVSAPTVVQKPSETPANGTVGSKGNYAGSEESFSLYGQSYKGNQAFMLVTTISEIVNRYPDKLDKFAEELVSVQKRPISEVRSIVYFKAGDERKVNGTVYSVGTVLSRDNKLAQIRRAISIVRENPDNFGIEGLYNEKQLKKAKEKYTRNSKAGSDKTVSAGKARNNYARNEISYKYFGKTGRGTQSKMMVEVIHAIIEKNFGKLSNFVQGLTSVEEGTLDELQEKKITYFNIGVSFTENGRTYSIGTSYGLEQKFAQIRKAIEIAGEDPRLFEIEGLYNDKQLKKAKERLGSSYDAVNVVVEETPAETVTEIVASNEEPEESAPQRKGNFAGSTVTYTYYGKTGQGTQGQMQVDVIHAIIEKNPFKFMELCEKLTCLEQDSLENLRRKKINYFNVGESFTENGITYSIGTSYGYEQKLAQIRKAIEVTKENPQNFEIDGLYNEKQLEKAIKNFES